MSLRFDFVSGRLHRLPHRPLRCHTHIRVALQVNNHFFKKNTVESATLCFPPSFLSNTFKRTPSFLLPSRPYSLSRARKRKVWIKNEFFSCKLAGDYFPSFLGTTADKERLKPGGLGKVRRGGGRGQPPTPICNAFFG